MTLHLLFLLFCNHNVGESIESGFQRGLLHTQDPSDLGIQNLRSTFEIDCTGRRILNFAKNKDFLTGDSLIPWLDLGHSWDSILIKDQRPLFASLGYFPLPLPRCAGSDRFGFCVDSDLSGSALMVVVWTLRMANTRFIKARQLPFGNIQSSLIQPPCHSKGKSTLKCSSMLTLIC
jgi:hypothetical protein